MEIMPEYTYVRTQAELIQIMSNPHLRFLSSHTIHDNLVEVIYERNPEYSNPPADVSPITAVFTTSNARVRLWKFISYLHPSQLLYCDTDSCYYVYDPENPNHKDPTKNTDSGLFQMGDGIGQWETELNDGNKFSASGAKSYMIECDNPKNNCIKTKGVTVDYQNKDIITFEAMASVAQSSNEIPISEQQTLLNKNS
jgi:hypothetical protein